MHLWNVLDFGMLSIFVASFTARFMAFLKASKAQQYVDMHVPDEDLSNASLPDEVAYFTYGKKLVMLDVLLLRKYMEAFCFYNLLNVFLSDIIGGCFFVSSAGMLSLFMIAIHLI